MMAKSDMFRRSVQTLTTPGRKHLLVVPGAQAEAIAATHDHVQQVLQTDPVLSKLPMASGTNLQQLQHPVVDPAKYFTDILTKDRVPPQPSWWSDLQQTLRHNPSQLLWTISSGVVDALKWIGWNYVDLVDQLRSWDGTWWGLMSHTTLLWRMVVTTLLTVGLIQAGPLLQALTEWIRLLGSMLSTTFGFVEEGLELLWQTLEDVFSFVTDRIIPARY